MKKSKCLRKVFHVVLLLFLLDFFAPAVIPRFRLQEVLGSPSPSTVVSINNANMTSSILLTISSGNATVTQSVILLPDC